MWCLAINTFEKSNEVKLGERGFVSDSVEIDTCLIIRVDEKLGLHDSAIMVNAGLHVLYSG